jgi:hypothetical protein
MLLNPAFVIYFHICLGRQQILRTSPAFPRLINIPQTLQELLAPRNVKFFSREGKELGDKTTLERQIHEITGIAISALRDTPLSEFGIKERLSWMSGRHTTRKEDKVYSLLGIFGIFLVPNYGEGEDYALKRFQRELDEASKDRMRQQVSYQADRMRVEPTRSKKVDQHGKGHIHLVTRETVVTKILDSQ